MARIKVDLPEEFSFSTQIKVRISDINYGGHLGNDSVVSLMHEARLRFFQSLGYKDELALNGAGTIQADLLVQYRNEAYQGDLIEVKIAITEIAKVSFDMSYLLVDSKSDNEIARGKTTIVTYDYEQKKKISIPQPLIEKLRQ